MVISRKFGHSSVMTPVYTFLFVSTFFVSIYIFANVCVVCDVDCSVVGPALEHWFALVPGAVIRRSSSSTAHFPLIAVFGHLLSWFVWHPLEAFFLRERFSCFLSHPLALFLCFCDIVCPLPFLQPAIGKGYGSWNCKSCMI